MTIHQAIQLFREHQKNSARDKTRESYRHLLRNLEVLLGERFLESIGSQDLYQFLITLTEGRAKNTARLCYAQLKPFFTFFIAERKTRLVEGLKEISNLRIRSILEKLGLCERGKKKTAHFTDAEIRHTGPSQSRT